MTIELNENKQKNEYATFDEVIGFFKTIADESRPRTFQNLIYLAASDSNGKSSLTETVEFRANFNKLEQLAIKDINLTRILYDFYISYTQKSEGFIAQVIEANKDNASFLSSLREMHVKKQIKLNSAQQMQVSQLVSLLVDKKPDTTEKKQKVTPTTKYDPRAFATTSQPLYSSKSVQKETIKNEDISPPKVPM